MKDFLRAIFVTPVLFLWLNSTAQSPKAYEAIYSGIPWLDNKGNTVSAHGACLIKEKDRFYLFGERHADNTNEFAGVTCYSSSDLYNWEFESIALPVQPAGKLGPHSVGERPKVMKCPQTGEYLMYLHADTLGYTGQFVGYATASSITGPYTFRGPLLFDGKPIRKWDMGTFQDTDGKGYVLLHGGDIYQLNEDYKSISRQVMKNMTPGFESPAIFRKDSVYFFLGSNLTGWERNDNYYFTTTSLAGPWTKRGLFCPEGSLTWNAQTSFVLPIAGTKDTSYLFMGDRWSFPYQASAATYVWQPLTVSGTDLSIPEYREAWKIETKTGTIATLRADWRTISNQDKNLIRYSGNWQQDTLSVITANEAGAFCSIKFTGSQIAFYGLARPDGGYARISIKNSKGKTVLSSIVDMYCKYPVQTLKFLSPRLKKDHYMLSVSVIGEHWYWVEKSGRRSGSRGNSVSVDRVMIHE